MTLSADMKALLTPGSIAIIGMSSREVSPSRRILQNLDANGFAGDIHLVGRQAGEIDGRPVLDSIDALPEGVDLAIFALPAAGIEEAVEGCVRRGVKAAVIYASGFAEVGEEALQDRITEKARAGGLALLGPNCLGFVNHITRLRINFVNAQELAPFDTSGDPAVAIVSQSGGLLAHFRNSFTGRGLQLSYSISTGNEAGLTLSDFVDFLAGDPGTSAIVIYAEQVRNAPDFLAAAARARDAGKPVIMLHPGRSARAQAATSSHTGALAGDYAVMKTQVSRAGVVLAETMDELIDTAEILARYPRGAVKGPGVVTFSGAYCAIAHDFCEDIDLDLPPLSAATEETMRAELPDFLTPRNPLDLATVPAFKPELMHTGPKAMIEDANLGSLVLSVPISSERHARAYMQGVIDAVKDSDKPVAFTVLGDRTPLAPVFDELARSAGMIVSRSVDRALRAMKLVTDYGRQIEISARSASAQSFGELPPLSSGPQPEWLGKQVLRTVGVAVPEGGLATDLTQAQDIAAQIGFPVVMKAQAGALAHKTEAGAVLLNIHDADGVIEAWTTLHTNVEAAQPGTALDGILVEKMAEPGLEIVIGAKRDPNWGPVVLVGMGGILVEALGDVRLIAPDAAIEDIEAELRCLRMAKMFDGFRGMPAVDLRSIAETASKIGQLILSRPEIEEIDVNPIFARADGVTAVDALIVTRDAT
ncbi:acetate--CoA ligase family protein [Marivita sp. S6314]|uniref:acetate--CoA ligase family protein n=1 Tax=Marivita sp. S6314 TaxID=2926406 RepID=UPI001FF5EC76|nr:acetate--CoA ligase family protein [Marivita sp. S6314]MCK0150876.1 acetate--CoA ligase family protein [Marivita sp. S6314]